MSRIGLPASYTLASWSDPRKTRFCSARSPGAWVGIAATLALPIPALAQSVNAVSDTGSAFAGTAATPIANVAANDTVNGLPAVLGPSGNATVTPLGTWPSGVALNTSSGAVSTKATVPAGVYSLQYTLCDLNSPPDCASTTDTITLTPVVVAIPDSGTAVAGVNSRAIANVAANDTVNALPATLGTTGNATVSQVGTWPTGIQLNSVTGAVVSGITVLPGTYSMTYRLCTKASKSTPCATAVDTITVNPAVSIIAVPEAGSAIAGIASTPIANVAANDSVNGAPATLGSAGNAVLAQVGTWPTGVTLNAGTGAIHTTSASAAGSYALTYELCLRTAHLDCATATDSVVVARNFAQVQVSTAHMDDIEFDWGRDGIYCATCNYGEGNARFNWTDDDGNLWVGHVDPTSGLFDPPAGTNELADTTAFNYSEFGNGPEWAFSTQNGQVVSQLVYTRWMPGTSAVPANAGAAFTTPVPGGWSAAFFPGAIGPTADGSTLNTVLPVASQCNTDTLPLAEFHDLASPPNAYWEPLSTDPATAPSLTPFGSYAASISGDKLGVRWVPCTHQLLFVGSAAPDASGNVYSQVFWFDTDTNVVQQLTFDAYQHGEAFMFQAPDFGDNYVFYATTPTAINVYEQTGTADNGAPIFQQVNSIASTDPAEPEIDSTEPFINCTPTCQTYVFMALRAAPQPGGASTGYAPNGLAVAALNPAQPLFTLLVPAGATPGVARTDPEYYITPNGPYLYFLKVTFPVGTSQLNVVGRFYIDMQLGAPSGPCVGSSAEGGLLPGC